MVIGAMDAGTNRPGGSQSLKERNGFLLDEMLTEEPALEHHTAQEDEVPRNQGPIKRIEECQDTDNYCSHSTQHSYLMLPAHSSITSVCLFFLFRTCALCLWTEVCNNNLFTVSSWTTTSLWINPKQDRGSVQTDPIEEINIPIRQQDQTSRKMQL